MQRLAHLVHESLAQPLDLERLRVLKREAARAIVTRNDKILLLYTERYDDFSFPGGGIDPGESPESGLHRELHEETGANEIKIVSHFGYVTEYAPTFKADWDLMYQTSHWYNCEIGHTLGDTCFEDYEIANGMSATWISLKDALAHNRNVIQRRPAKMGISIHRETLVLEQVVKALAESSQVPA